MLLIPVARIALPQKPLQTPNSLDKAFLPNYLSAVYALKLPRSGWHFNGVL